MPTVPFFARRFNRTAVLTIVLSAISCLTMLVASAAAPPNNDATKARQAPPVALPARAREQVFRQPPPAAASMSISAVQLAVAINNPVMNQFLARAGEALVVTGASLDGATGVMHYAIQVNGAWVANAQALRKFPVTFTGSSSTRLDFRIPAEAFPVGPSSPMVVVLTKGAQSLTATQLIMLGRTPTPRVITSVAQTAVRAGLRVTINGTGFDDVPSAYNGVIGGHFGNGTPGSTSNRMFPVINRSETSVQLLLPQDCDQQGLLTLEAPRAGGGTGQSDYISATPPITVACASANPQGQLVGYTNTPLTARQGDTVTIRGTRLHLVNKVFDQTGIVNPFRYERVGGLTGFDQLIVTLVQPAGRNVAFFLSSVLTDPVYDTAVPGSIVVVL